MRLSPIRCSFQKVIMDLEFDFVVVGAGTVGSWTARELRKHGKVLLLEQFREPHTRGSSHGQTRLIRSGYEEPFFADMMPHAYKMWRLAESETKQKLLMTTGLLCIADSKEDKSLVSRIQNMKRLCPEHLEILSGADVKSRYPSTLKFSKDAGFIFDKSGGVLFAHKSVRVIQEAFQKDGGTFWDSCKVTGIVPQENTVKIVTSKGDVYGKSVVVCSGPWTKEVLGDLAPPSLPLEPQAVQVYYWKEKEPGVYSAAAGFPATQYIGDIHVYSLPSQEYPGLQKVCVHGGEPCGTPEERDKVPVNKRLEDFLYAYVKEHMPLLETEPAITEKCMYTCTPDEAFVIDTLPGHKNIAIGAGFSGSGFKTSPVVGRLLSELARGVKPFLDLTPFRLSRFSESKK